MSDSKTLIRWRDEKLLEYGSLEQWEETRQKGFTRFMGRYAAIITVSMVVMTSIFDLLVFGQMNLTWLRLVFYSVQGYITGSLVWQQNNKRYRQEKALLKVADPKLLD